MKLPTSYRAQMGDAATFLLDRNWLHRRYVVERLSSRQIARLAGCGKKAVLTALRRFDIEVARSGTNRDLEALSARGKLQNMPEAARGLLDDRHWLQNAFVAQNKSLTEISKLCGVSIYCVRRWLKRHRIKKVKSKWWTCSQRRYMESNGFAPGSEQACRKRMSGRRARQIATRKAGIILCHSTWEEAVAKLLDAAHLVGSFGKDVLKIPYNFEGKLRTYYVDFLVTLVDGRSLAIEVKAKRLLTDKRVIAKLEALGEYAIEAGISVLVVSGKHKPDTSKLEAAINAP